MSATAQEAGDLAFTVSRFATAVAVPTGPAFGTMLTTTWPAFAGLFKRRRQGKKNGPCFAPARFRPEPDGAVRRILENVLTRTAIVLDIETDPKTGEVPPSFTEALARVEARGWTAVGYTSHSHAPAAPRYRIVVPLSGEIAADLPAAEVVAGLLRMDGVLDTGKVGPASVFYLPSCAPGKLAQHETVAIEGQPIDAAWMVERAGALLAEREAVRERQRAEAMEAAAKRREARIRKGFDPNSSIIELIRGHLDLRGELIAHRYTAAGEGRYLYPGSETGVAGVYTMSGRDGVERVFSHHSGDPLAAGNLPSWCRAKAIDAVDVVTILDFAGDQKAALRALATRFGIETRPASTPPPPDSEDDYGRTRARPPHPDRQAETDADGAEADTSPANENDPGFHAGNASQNDPVVLSAGAPLLSAREYIRRHHTEAGLRTLHHQNSGFYTWTGTHYIEVPPEEMRGRLYGFLDKAFRTNEKGNLVPFDPNKNKVANVLEATSAEAQLSARTPKPAWLSGSHPQAPADVIACANSLLHIPTRNLLPHTPAFFNTNALSFAYQADAPEPTAWLTFLKQIWPDDQPAIDTLQETFGLLLTGDTRHQKAFLMVGPKRCGKGTIARVLTNLLGQDNVCAPTLGSIGERFGLMPMIGKRLAIISDARIGGRADQGVIVERILSITGEDTLTIDRKNRDFWTGKLDTRFVMLTNELPRLTDSSGAFASRFIILVLKQSFFKREDHGLLEKLLPELPGILNWGLCGLVRLRARGYFVPPASSEEAQAEMEDLGSPIGAFLRDRCVVAPGRIVDCQRLFNAWCAWCRDNNRDQPGTVQVFGRDLRAAVPGLSIVQPRDIHGKQVRCYEGVEIDFGQR